MSQSVAGYYQESGRAGRDGKKSYCRLYHSHAEKQALSFLISMDVNRNKQEGKDSKAQAIMDNFEAMIKYCENGHCRHSFFSKYFGDEEPLTSCGKMCDFCKNPGAVNEQIDSFNNMDALRLRSKMSAGVNIDGVDEDLYGGGKVGTKKDNEGFNEGHSGSGDDGEKKAKSALESLIKQQFSLRNGKKESVSATAASLIDQQIGKNARVRAAEATSTKIRGLSIAFRETYLNSVIDALDKNYHKMREINEDDRVLSVTDIRDCAVDVEYGIFTKNHVFAVYRQRMAFAVSVKCEFHGCFIELTAKNRVIIILLLLHYL
jgi:ATP-dependent DNA helicase Q5